MPLISGKSLAKIACSFITSMVVVFPLVLAVVCALPNFFGGWGLVWDGHPYDFYFLPDIKRHLLGGVVLACIWGTCFVLFCRSRFFVDARHLPIKLFLITLVSRGVIALTVGQFVSPISDFAFAWDRACTGCVNPEYSSHLLCPTWMAFSMFEHFWVRLFGSNMGLGLLCSAIFNATTAVMIYYFAMYVFRQCRIAFIAASIYIFYPSSIVYTLTATPEHMGIACFMVMAVLIAKCVSVPMASGRRLLLVVAAGVVAGFGNSVRPIFMLYAIATAICLGISLSRGGMRRWRFVRTSCALFAVFLVVEVCTFGVIIRGAERMFCITLRGVSSMPHCFCVGLNRQGEGQIHVGGLSRTWHRLLAEGVRPEIATKETYDIVLEDWRSHWDEIVPFFAKKFVWTWQDDNRPFGMAMLQLGKKVGEKVLDSRDREVMAKAIVNRELGGEGSGNGQNESGPSSRAQFIDHVWQSVQTAGFVWYFSIMVLAAVSVVLYGRRNQGNVLYACNCLFVLGYCGIVILSEAQSRYKCLVMPYVFILAAPLIAKLFIKDQSGPEGVTF